MRAVELDALGWAHRDIAIAPDVSEAAVSQWNTAARNPSQLNNVAENCKQAAMQIALFIVLLFVGCGSCLAGGTRYISREDWTNEKATFDESLRQPDKIRWVTIHQTEGRNGDSMSREDEKVKLRSILTVHRNKEQTNNEKKKWGDIAYHYIIGPSGDVYRCRDLAFQSDSATILRSDLRGNITICLMGDFRTAKEKQYDNPPTTTPDQLPTEAAVESLVSVVAMELRKHGLDAGAVKAHRDLQMIKGGSDCPGGLFYPSIKSDLLPKIEKKLAESGLK